MTVPLSLRACAVAAAVMLVLPGQGRAQRLDLSVSPTVISFPPADPDALAIVISSPVTITYRVRQWSGPWQLTVIASGDLTSGASSIDISNVSWIGNPAPAFHSGTLSRTVAQVVASGNGVVNPMSTGSLTFRMANSWHYNTGNYTQTIVFTLSTP